jgi:NAD(P)-dependent dehydrogenase (short-subunit alcohol dehydrogenase family)
MEDFKNKVAVITGASSGIGKAIAGRCLEEGMRVVLAGINLANLHAAEKELSQPGRSILCVQTDVSKSEDVVRLAEKTVEAFGGAHLLVNNAGVYAGTTIWETTPHDWEWVLKVNLWGTLNTIRIFVPIMLAQDTDCHVVNVSSIAGLMVFPGWGTYKVTKASQITISETLAAELADRGARIGVSVVCPGFVKTRIANAARNRPPEYPETVVDEAIEQGIRDGVNGGVPPEAILDPIFDGIRANQLYIFTHPDSAGAFQERFETIVASADQIKVEEVK